MNRSFSTQAIIFSIKPLGENNSSVTLFSKDKGIIFATLYGGPKSKLRSLVAQWHSGTIWLYETPEKNQTKISDFDVSNYHYSFGENLFKMYAASLAAELAIKSNCAGSIEQCYRLLSGFLDGMELCNEDQSKLGLIRFLWRYLELLGIQPQTHNCSFCGKSFLDSQFAPDDFSYYNNIDNNFICHSCKLQDAKNENFIQIKTTAVQYLTAISVLSPSEVRKLQVDKESYNQLKQLVFFLIENNIEKKLNTIEIGVGIL